MVLKSEVEYYTIYILSTTQITYSLSVHQLFRTQRNVPFLDIVCDSMRGDMVSRYGAWPERLYIIVDGVIVYQGKPSSHTLPVTSYLQ